MWKPGRFSKQQWAWATYDWANSAFFTTIVAGFFPVFFKDFWSAGVDSSTSTLMLGLANGAAGALIAVLNPFLGCISDKLGRKLNFVLFFTALGCLSTGMLAAVPKGDWQSAVILFVIASACVAAAISFNDAQLMDVAEPKDYEIVSSLGFSLGYLGGGLLFAVNVAMTLKPEFFRLPDAATAVQVSFLMVAIWWAIFTIPLWRHVRDKDPQDKTYKQAFNEGIKTLVGTAKEVLSNRNMRLFLLAYWLYIDGVGTVFKMAVDFGRSLGLGTPDLITALIVTQFVGFPAAYAFGIFAEKFSGKVMLYIGLAIYTGVVTYGLFLETATEFFVLAGVIGLVQGGVQAMSRALFGRLTPAARSAEFFGVYNMMGKFAAILGPVVLGLTSYYTGNPRTSLFSLVFFFASGAYVLSKVDFSSNK